MENIIAECKFANGTTVTLKEENGMHVVYVNGETTRAYDENWFNDRQFYVEIATLLGQ